MTEHKEYPPGVEEMTRVALGYTPKEWASRNDPSVDRFELKIDFTPEKWREFTDFMAKITPPVSAEHVIRDRLDTIEARHDVRILYACESGSRAWGFASPDSDYDVRFIYVRRQDWYLSINEGRDVIEEPPDPVWDINGWDLRKALRLFRNSNPTLLEWLQSPIVYTGASSVALQMLKLISSYHSPKSSLHHYLNMAHGNWTKYLATPDTVSRKRYFYVLRPILAAQWVTKGLGPAPIEFERLLRATELPRDVRTEIVTLLAEKMAGGEKLMGPRNLVLNEYIRSQFDSLRSKQLNDLCSGREMRAPDQDVEPLNKLFRDALWEAWGL